MDRNRGHANRKTLMANKGFITWDYICMYIVPEHSSFYWLVHLPGHTE